MERLLMESGESPSDPTGKKPHERKFYGVTVGRVINPIDFLSVGRVQVQLPFIDSGDLSAFARVAVPMAGIFSGDYFIPNPGDEVLVAFEHGDLDSPIIIGSLWNVVQRPPMPTPLAQLRAIRTLTGNQIVFSELPPSITIQTAPTPPTLPPLPATPTAPFPTIQMTSLGVDVATAGMIMLQAGPTTSIIMNPAGITLQAGSNVVSITAAGITINSTTLVDIQGAASVTILGGIVQIN
jgi:hypothetical protein